MCSKQVPWLHESKNLRILLISFVQIPVNYLCRREYSLYFHPANWSCTDLSDIWKFKKNFFLGPGTVALRPWVPPASCRKLNPGSLIHDHVSFLSYLSTDTLNTEFWKFDSELHGLGLSICVNIPNVLVCSELVSLFRDCCLIFLGLGICSFRFLAERPETGPLLYYFGL